MFLSLHSAPLLAEATVSLEIWGGMAVALLLTAALGFVSGLLYARWSSQFALERAGRELTKLFQAVLRSLETAEQACGMLEKFPRLLLSEEQTARLDGRRRSLIETVNRVVESRTQTLQQKEAAAARAWERLEQFNVSFVRTPEDYTTKLPDRTAFDANLDAVLAAGQQSGHESGLLLVKIDRFDHLKKRFGRQGVEVFLQKMASVLCRAIREADLVCRVGEDTFGVLLPAVDGETGRDLADAIRTSVRQHHFRKEETGPEVLVTASFGYTTCQPGDDREFAMNRAGDAVEESQRRGRNQLHVHSGGAVAACAT
jgi:two-component system, cell cycle response regulator